jgi:hypothetical protein
MGRPSYCAPGRTAQKLRAAVARRKFIVFYTNPPATTVCEQVRKSNWRVLLRTIILLFLLSGSSFAASVNSHYSCVQGHEQEATTKFQALGTQAVTNFFKHKNIEINVSTLQFSTAVSEQSDIDGAPYFAFAGNAGGNSGPSVSSIAGIATATDGTKFNVLFSSGSDEQNTGEYRAVGTQSGFDREGNPIHRHCSLKLFDAGDGNGTKDLLVLNAGSGHVLGRIPLPGQIPLY